MANLANLLVARHGDMAMSSSSPNMSSMSNATSSSSMSMGGSCKISMLWNWTTIDACFLARSWHVTTKAMFAGTVIGIFFLCMAIEGVRRAAREYDRRITAAAVAQRGPLAAYQPTLVQQALRSAMYGVQFTAAFLVMLLGMYYNGYVLFAIFLGHTFGYFFFARDTCAAEETAGKVDSGCAC